jgi:hypothetical protein
MYTSSGFRSTVFSRFSAFFITFTIASMVSFSAYSVDFESGDWSASVDTTATTGMGWRVENQDKAIIGLSGDPVLPGPLALPGAGSSITGTAFSENSDDGNQNFNEGTISKLGKFTTEIELDNKNGFGIFTRFYGFKDWENDSAGNRTELGDKADRLVTENFVLQDLYLWGDFNMGKMPASIRVGKQVLSWGESTFIQNGINVINPFDVSKLRTPGSKIRDALVPVGMVTASVSPTDDLSLEGFYSYSWRRTQIEPVGSYFSTNDFVGDDGRKVMLGFGGAAFGTGFIGSDRGTSFGALTPFINIDLGAGAGFVPGSAPNALAGFEPDFLGVLRAPDDRPGNGGEFGFAFRYFAENLNSTEFGLFFINHHSRTPIISAITGTAQGAADATAAAIGIAGIPGVIPPPVGATFAALTAALGSAAAAAAALPSIASAVATDQYARTANYLIEYPEDIQRVGLSFNTELQKSGVALQGEYTFIHDAPLQVDDVELLFRALCPLAALNPAVAVNQLDPGCTNTTTDQYLPGFIERNVSQVQVTATKVLGPVIGANTGVLIGEVGVTHVHNMPNKSDLRLNGPGTFTSGDPFQATAAGAHAGKAAENADNFADATSWGIRMAGRLTYNNAIGAVNLSPRFAFSQDISGITPGPGGNFVEGRRAVTVGVGADYQNSWAADLSYTSFQGAGRYNLMNDRDFAAFNVNYSF